MGLRFYPGTNTSHYLDLLHEAADSNPEKFSVYTHETMPERFHFSNSPRIAPIWILPNIGYALTNRKEVSEATIMSKGVRFLFCFECLYRAILRSRTMKETNASDQRRTMDTIIVSLRCRLSSSRMGPSPRYQRTHMRPGGFSPVRLNDPTNVGIRWTGTHTS
jgi:hypothetical protein